MYLINKYQVQDKEITFIEVSLKDFKVTMMDYGATLMSIFTPDKDGNKETVLLAYDNLDAYIENDTYLNATVGPFAGRISNSRFSINGEEYVLDSNHLKTENLHAGKDGFSFRNFDYDVVEENDLVTVTFTYVQKEEESNFPGEVTTKVIYKIYDQTVEINYEGTSTKDTLYNLTNHAYFNLSGNLKSTIMDQEVYINSSKALELNDKFSPIGVYDSKGTHLDFTTMKKVKDNFFEGIYDRPELGIDNPLLLDEVGLDIKQVEMVDPISKRSLEVYTTYPCIVCYTHNHVNDKKFLFDKEHVRHMGICFEMQYEPNGINVEGLNDSILRKEDTYKETIIFKFGIKE